MTTGTPIPVTVRSLTTPAPTIRTLVSMTTGTPIPVTVLLLITAEHTTPTRVHTTRMPVRTIHMPEHMTRMLELTIPTQVPTILTQERMTRTVRKIAVARNTISRSTIKIVDV